MAVIANSQIGIVFTIMKYKSCFNVAILPYDSSVFPENHLKRNFINAPEEKIGNIKPYQPFLQPETNQVYVCNECSVPSE